LIWSETECALFYPISRELTCDGRTESRDPKQANKNIREKNGINTSASAHEILLLKIKFKKGKNKNKYWEERERG